MGGSIRTRLFYFYTRLDPLPRLRCRLPSPQDKNMDFTAPHAVICGGLAGALSQTVTYPLDTVRKFMQANTFLYKYQVSL